MPEPSIDVLTVLTQVIAGDAQALSQIAAVDDVELADAARRMGPSAVLTRAAVARVVAAFRDGEISPAATQTWASFVRRGYASTGRKAVRPLNLDYEEAWEDAIVECVGRLDEIGDVIDGSLSPAEVQRLLDLLDQA